MARGGTLFQDIPTIFGAAIEHRQQQPGRVATHDVRLLPGSRLEGVMGRLPRDVNSFHHQSVDELGRGLRACAWAPDGVVEAVEALDRDFAIGVQWHAESLSEREDQAGMFGAFIAAASRFESSASRARRRTITAAAA